MEFDTKLVQAGNDMEGGDVVRPIHVAATFEQRTQSDLRYFYGRGENATREDLEKCLASLENAAHALTFSSGQAAGATALSLLSPGQTLISSDDVYGGTYALFSMLPKHGIDVTYQDLSAPEALDRVLTPSVGLIWLETPTNPLLKITDIRAVVERAHAMNIPVVVDNTFASPVLQQPLELGADITLYSTTKFISGHSDVIGGALVYNSDEFHETFLSYRTTQGNIPGALDCFLVRRGLKTLTLRVHRQNDNARVIAEELLAAPKVGAVRYPGLPDHPHHDVAKSQMRGYGAVITFDYLGLPDDLLRRVKRFSVAVSLGSVHSLIECPAMMTHRPIPADVRRSLGITDNLIRLAVGIEDPRDLITDLRQAL